MNAKHRTPGFTVVELTIVLALVSVIMSLIIVRFDWGSQRQHAIAEARKLGNAIRACRERAMNEQQVYALQLDLNENLWSIRKIDQTSSAAAQSSPALYTTACDKPIKILSVKTSEGLELPTPVILALDPRGTMAGVFISMGADSGARVTMQIDPLVNEIDYAEH